MLTHDGKNNGHLGNALLDTGRETKHRQNYRAAYTNCQNEKWCALQVELEKADEPHTLCVPQLCTENLRFER